MSTRPKRSPRAVLLPPLIRLAETVPAPMVRRMRGPVAALLSRVPGWHNRVATNMRAALGEERYRPEHIRRYFDHLGELFCNAALVYRYGIAGAGLGSRWTADNRSETLFRAAAAQGKGAVMVCPHLIGHEIMAGIVAHELPVTALVRKSPDEAYEALKQRWYAALEVEVCYRPTGNSAVQGMAELTAALRPLRKGRILALTPDLLQRSGTGIPVRLFGRKAELPAGPFFLAARTGAPFFPSFFVEEEGGYRLYTHEPLEFPPEMEREAALAAAAQQWAELFEEYVREHPDMWQFWLDTKWTRWLQRSGRARGGTE